MLSGGKVDQMAWLRLATYSHPYLWWFCGHLDTGLQNWDREVGVGARAEPEAKGRVRILHLQLFHQFVQIRHPRQWQVAVSQEHPMSCKEMLIQCDPFPKAHLSPHFPPDYVRMREEGSKCAGLPLLGPSGEVKAALMVLWLKLEVLENRIRPKEGGNEWFVCMSSKWKRTDTFPLRALH